MKVICILGPTAVGKSDLALRAAKRFDGEVINADSMQVYRHLPIGTALPPPSMLAAAPHHLFAFLEPDATPDAGFFARAAAEVIRDVDRRGHVPVLVGGTFFWVRALLHGLAPLQPIPDAVKQEVRKDLAHLGPQALHRRLMDLDPITAARLAPGDSQRIARALEVAIASGHPLSEHLAQGVQTPLPEAQTLKLVLAMDRARLYERINARVVDMIRDGLVDEVRAVLAAGFARDIRPLRSSSYVPVLEFLDRRITAARMQADIAQGHRNYAKRQLTWLRSESEAVVMDIDDQDGCMARIEAFLAGTNR